MDKLIHWTRFHFKCKRLVAKQTQSEIKKGLEFSERKEDRISMHKQTCHCNLKA